MHRNLIETHCASPKFISPHIMHTYFAQFFVVFIHKRIISQFFCQVLKSLEDTGHLRINNDLFSK